jgi:hypothetical protein
MALCEPYLAGSGALVDPAFASRLPEGMIRACLVRDEVVGFARQRPTDSSAGTHAPPPDKVLGLPAAKTMCGPAEPEFAPLRARLRIGVGTRAAASGRCRRRRPAEWWD